MHELSDKNLLNNISVTKCYKRDSFFKRSKSSITILKKIRKKDQKQENDRKGLDFQKSNVI